jgi:hypothetical protein
MVGLNGFTNGSNLRHPILCILAIPVQYTAWFNQTLSALNQADFKLGHQRHLNKDAQERQDEKAKELNPISIARHCHELSGLVLDRPVGPSVYHFNLVFSCSRVRRLGPVVLSIRFC